MDSSAIFGFAGVLVGGGSTYVIQRGAERRNDKASARVGIRLSHLDFVELTATMRRAVSKGEIWEAGAIAVPKWDEYSEALAKTLPLDEWIVVEHAIYQARTLETEARRAAAAGTSGPLTDGQRKLIEEVIDELDAATEKVAVDWMYKTQPWWERVKAKTREVWEKRRKGR